MAIGSPTNYRISVDTGGTFTDVVVADSAGHLHIGKAGTTPEHAYYRSFGIAR